MSDEFNPMLPPLDDAKVEEMIGKLVLVGVTRYGGDGQVQGLEQYAGTVLRISADEGVVLAELKKHNATLAIVETFSSGQIAGNGVYTIAAASAPAQTTASTATNHRNRR